MFIFKIAKKTFMLGLIFSAASMAAPIIDLMPNSTWIDEYSGQLSADGIVKYLADAFANKKIDNPYFKSAECLKAKKSNVEGSYNTVQLFIVRSSCVPNMEREFIVKEARDGFREATSLNRVENLPHMAELSDFTSQDKALPSIALPLFYLTYLHKYSGSRIVAIMPKAKGQELCNFIKSFRDDPNQSNEFVIGSAFKMLGFQLANFHQLYAIEDANNIISDTIPHGDFHCFNIFYDSASQKFTFIDNETIDWYIDAKKSPADDILKPFLGLISTSEPSDRRDVISGIDHKRWFNISFSNFLIGYVMAFSFDDRPKVIDELYEMINSPIRQDWFRLDDETLDLYRKDIFNPILANIKNLLQLLK